MSWGKYFKNEEYPHGTFHVGDKMTVPGHAVPGKPRCTRGMAPHEHTILGVHEGPVVTVLTFDGYVYPEPGHVIHVTTRGIFYERP